MSDVTLQEAATMGRHIHDQGGTFRQKFTCQHCQSRQTMDDPDVLYTSGVCEECGQETSLLVQGCGLIAIWPVRGRGIVAGRGRSLEPPPSI